jgi:hypothetical protein
MQKAVKKFEEYRAKFGSFSNSQHAVSSETYHQAAMNLQQSLHGNNTLSQNTATTSLFQNSIVGSTANTNPVFNFNTNTATKRSNSAGATNTQFFSKAK